ncbi:MAG: restriction endonuclease subunit S [Candidatus Wallbacteria bacterium]|nr:restriction endonuclease subunit S [Candidatus Wallbacteria bacterium]
MRDFFYLPLKYVLSVTSGATPASANESYWNGDIPWVTPEDISNVKTGYLLTNTSRKISLAGYNNCGVNVLPKSSLVLTKRAPIGQLAILDIDACSNQGCFILTPNKSIDPRFYYYFLLANKEKLQSLGRGSTFLELSTDEIKALQVPKPEYSIQNSIADYLDKETSKIDELITAKEKLLAILEEKRRALITQTVLRGISREVKFKDSGVKWIGKIPEHWKITKLKRILDRIDYGISDLIGDVGKVAVLRMGDIQNMELDFKNVGFIDSVDSSLLLNPGDLVFNRTNSLDQIGKVAIFRGFGDFPVSLSSYLVRLRCKKGVNPEFVNYFLNSTYSLSWSRSEALPSIGQANLNPNKYSSLPITVPPISEQSVIVDYIKKELLKLDSIYRLTKQTTMLLNERRLSLINAVVKGSKEVSSL